MASLAYKYDSFTKPLKLHSADIPYLSVLAHFKRKGSYCYATKEQWPELLVQFGGAAIHYRKQKARWAKMRALGYVIMVHTNGNRNKEMEHHLTESGLQALNQWKKTAPRARIRRSKRPLDVSKTAPPLTHALIMLKKHAFNNIDLENLDPDLRSSYERMLYLGMFTNLIKKYLKFCTKAEMFDAYEELCNKQMKGKVRKPGAYMSNILERRLNDRLGRNYER